MKSASVELQRLLLGRDDLAQADAGRRSLDVERLDRGFARALSTGGIAFGRSETTAGPAAAIRASAFPA